jgi:transcriptional regulator NrdR family protein
MSFQDPGTDPKPPLQQGSNPDLMGLMQKNEAAGRGVLAAEQSEMAPLVSGVQKTLAKPAPAAPQLQQPPKPPQQGSELADNAAGYIAAATVLGAIAGAFTRNHTTNALGAFTGMLTGLKEGNLQKFQQSYQTWKAQNDQVIESNRVAMDQYKAILEDRRRNIDEQMAGIQLVAAKYKDQITYEAATARNYTLVAQIMERNAFNQQKLEQNAEKMTQMYDLQKKKLDMQLAQNGMTMDESGEIKIDSNKDSPVEKQAQAIANYQQAPLSSSGQRSPLNRIIMARVMDINPNYQAARYGAQATALRQFGTGRQGDAIRSMNVAISHLGTFEQLVDALQSGDVRVLNQAKQQWQIQTGQPAPTNFEAAKHIIGQEVVKAIVAGGGGVTERQQAGEILDRVQSPQQLKGAIVTIKKLLGGQLEGLKRQYEQATGQSDFETKLSPEVKGQLEGQGAPAAAPGGGGPSPGAVEDGYRFKGGDPKKQENWEQVT